MKPLTMNSAAISTVVHIPDVQNSADTRRLAINKVGIKDIRHPVKVRDRSGGEHGNDGRERNHHAQPPRLPLERHAGDGGILT